MSADIIDFATGARLDANPPRAVPLPVTRRPVVLRNAGLWQGRRVRVRGSAVQGLVLGRHRDDADRLLVQQPGVARWYTVHQLDLLGG